VVTLTNNPTTKICGVCGIERTINDFVLVCRQSGKYRGHTCRRCRNEQDRARYVECRVENKLLYGTACSPKWLKRNRLRQEVKRHENRKKYGTTRTPAETEKARKQSKIRGNRNRELYGTAGTPEELEKVKRRVIEKRVGDRALALTLLGNRCTCCGEDRPEMLTFDHIYGGGTKSKERSARIIREILTMKDPASKYRILCWNCNFALWAYGYCPHQGRPPEEEPVNKKHDLAKYRRQLNRRHKLEFVVGYDGECVICGETNWEFLCVDHINGGGRQHMKSLGKRGIGFYIWLKKQGYPKEEYRLLCLNCNCSKKETL